MSHSSSVSQLSSRSSSKPSSRSTDGIVFVEYIDLCLDSLLVKVSTKKSIRKSYPVDLTGQEPFTPVSSVRNGVKRKLDSGFPDCFQVPKMTSSSSSSELFCNRYAPKTSSQVACSKKKLEEIRQWIANAVSSSVSLRLVLWGNVGTGKSTLINLLLSEMKITKVAYEYDESSSDSLIPSVTYPSILNKGNSKHMLVCEATSVSSLLCRHYNFSIIFIVSSSNSPQIPHQFNTSIIHYPNPTASSSSLALTAISCQTHSTSSLSSVSDLRHAIQCQSINTPPANDVNT